MASAAPKMDPLARALVRAFVDRPPDRSEASRRAAYGLLEGYVSVFVNTVLFVVKLLLGLATGSLSLLADAVHTLSDSVTSVVVIVSAYAGRKPADSEHPYGHGRVESIATVTVAVLLGVVAFEFGKASVERILHPQAVAASWVAIGVVAATAAVKEWLSSFALALGRASGNSAVEADAWHHRSDVFATILVVVAMVFGRYGIATVDGWMGLLVAVVIAKVAFDIARGAVDTLIGAAPSPEEVEEIKRAALSVEGVRSVHDIVVHRYGQTRFISLHIETTDKADAPALHAVAELVEDRVGGESHGSVCVHVDPVDADHPAYDRVRALLVAAVEADPTAASFHDLRVVGSESRFDVLFDLNVVAGCSDEDARASRDRLVALVKDEIGAHDVVVAVDPAYSYQP